MYRLYTFQWLERDKYTAAASEAHQRNITVPARRGAIYDTNGYPLAVTVDLNALMVVGKNVTKPDFTAQALAPLLEMSPADIAAKIDPTRGDAVVIKDHLSAGISDAIDAEIERSQLQGLALEARPVREYPEGSIAPQIARASSGRIGRTGRPRILRRGRTRRPGRPDRDREPTSRGRS